EGGDLGVGAVGRVIGVELEEVGGQGVAVALAGGEGVAEDAQGHDGADGDRDGAAAGIEGGLGGRQRVVAVGAAESGRIEAAVVDRPGQQGRLGQVVGDDDVAGRAGAVVGDGDGEGGGVAGVDHAAGAVAGDRLGDRQVREQGHACRIVGVNDVGE